MKATKIFLYVFLAISSILLSCEEETMKQPERLEISLVATHVSTYGATDGSVSSTISGGEAPYYFVWNTGETSQDLSNVPAGTYTLKVIYGNEGVSEASVTVQEPAGMLKLEVQTTDVSWYGGNDGAINISVKDGVSPYTYSWLHNEEEAGPSVTALSAGVYQVTITDAGSKPVEMVKSIVVGQPDFVCGRDTITDVDGNKYPTVQIGDQCWTATNLITTHKPDQPEQVIEGRYCKGSNCQAAMGAHYTWQAVMNGAESANGDTEVQGICPNGWHLPTRDNWKTLNSYLTIEGNGGTGTNVPNKMRGTESPSGFDALLAGNWGYSVFTGELAAFWSSTANESQDGRAYFRLLHNFPLLGEGHEDIRSGLSCRCVLNKN
ncbi:MAG: hypothetical protein HC819_22730 [Cyclobacteriaceae bacterium]|nr:hypothetical protein [Cyclobacteriaceae bacterium]